MSRDVAQEIQETIDANPVVLFMKGTPNFPQCGFSAQCVEILHHVGTQFVGVNVLEDPEVRQGIKDFSSWPTIPQLYIKGQFIGGCDITRELFQTGDLQSQLSDAGLIGGGEEG